MKNKLINPFRYLPLRQAICWGIAALIITSIFFWQTGLRLTSITQLNFAGDHLLQATLRQVAVWLLFSVVLYGVGVVLSRSKVRFWDVASFNLFARIPFDLSTLLFAIPSVRSVTALMTEGSLQTALQYTTLLTVISVVSMVCTVWYFYWSYKAFAEATNVKNGRGVAAFALSFVVTYVASGYLLVLI